MCFPTLLQKHLRSENLKDVEYAYAVAYIKTIENKMLTRADIETLIAADGFAVCRRLLTEKGWTGETASELLKNELEKSWSTAYEVAGDETPIDILLYENDFHNLKTVLKALVAGRDWHGMTLSPSKTEPEEILAAIKSGDMSDLPPFMRETAAEAYRILTTTMDGQLAEIYIDKQEHLAVLSRAKAEKDEFLIGWAELLAKLTNMKTAWRCMKVSKSQEFLREALVPDGSNVYNALCTAGDLQNVIDIINSYFPEADTSSIGAFEKWCDNKRLAYVKSAKAQSFGFQPIMAFLVGKSFEIQAVRIILSCKENGVGEEVIRERLRDMYV